MSAQEEVPRVAPLGFRPWDMATSTDVRVALAVTCQTPRGRVVRAIRTASGAYLLRGLPGLVAGEQSDEREENAPFRTSPPIHHAHHVRIIDPSQTYVPVSVTVEAPAHGLYSPPCATRLSADTGCAVPAKVVPLFSAPTRSVPAACAVVRAQLELRPGVPASWALLHVMCPDGHEMYGLADGAGMIAVLFPYPKLPVVAGMAGTGPLVDQSWPLRLRGFFGLAGSVAPVAAPDAVPDLCKVLAQDPVDLLADVTTVLSEARLTYGRELTLRTKDRSTLLLRTPTLEA